MAGRPADRDGTPVRHLFDAPRARGRARFRPVQLPLGQLEGQNIERTDDGYQLLRPGLRVVQSVMAGVGFEFATLDPTPVDSPCPVCGSATEVAYRNAIIYHVCTACDGLITGSGEHPPGGTLAALPINPAVLGRDSPEQLLEATYAEAVLSYSLRGTGICPHCSGAVTARLHVCEDHDADPSDTCDACGRGGGYDTAVLSVRSVCKSAGRQGVIGYAMSHPAVWAFYWRNGIDELGGFELSAIAMEPILQRKVEEELVSTTPLRVRLTFHDEGHELQLTYDEDLEVVELIETEWERSRRRSVHRSI